MQLSASERDAVVGVLVHPRGDEKELATHVQTDRFTGHRFTGVRQDALVVELGVVARVLLADALKELQQGAGVAHVRARVDVLASAGAERDPREELHQQVAIAVQGDDDIATGLPEALLQKRHGLQHDDIVGVHEADDLARIEAFQVL